MRSGPEFSSVYPRLLLQSRLLPARKMLAGTSLDEDSLASREFVGWEVQAALLKNLSRSQADAGWAAALGARFGISSHGPLGFAALSAPHMLAAFRVIEEYLSVRTTAVTCRVDVSASSMTISLDDRTGDPDMRDWLGDMVLKTFESLIGTLRGRPVDERVTVCLGRPRPRRYRELVRTFHGHVVFSAPEYAISVPSEWVRQPSPLHDEPVYRANIDKCIEIMSRREQTYRSSEAVRHLLKRHFDDCIDQSVEPSPPPGLDEIAGRLYLGSRTLIRRLKAESTSYRQILLDLRRESAERLLRDARLTVADVSTLLGYREPANFGRAFRRWYGVSPAVWRRR